ncbi:hypothetical protein FM102_14420 [Corynebacterium glutamicum]|nr:hypothetical protein FM102_14420 [Corynebacterium glutamicum]
MEEGSPSRWLQSELHKPNLPVFLADLEFVISISSRLSLKFREH